MTSMLVVADNEFEFLILNAYERTVRGTSLLFRYVK